MKEKSIIHKIKWMRYVVTWSGERHFFAFLGDNKELREIWVAFYFGEIELMKSEIRIGT